MAGLRGSNGRLWAVGAAVLGFAWLAVYLTLILSEGNNTVDEIGPWAVAMATAPTLASASVFVSRIRVAQVLLGVAAAIFLVLGILSALTIGVGFLLASTAALIGIPKLVERTLS